MKFEDNLSKKIDMSKVKIDVLKPWITKRVYEMLKMEDDVVVEFIFNQLEDEKVCILIVIIYSLLLLYWNLSLNDNIMTAMYVVVLIMPLVSAHR